MGEHSHVHAQLPDNLTPWILFTIFVFGPCEPLIPLVMFPAAEHTMVGVASGFGVRLDDLTTMLAVVIASFMGSPGRPCARWSGTRMRWLGFRSCCAVALSRYLGFSWTD